jgi:hypothetical protein
MSSFIYTRTHPYYQNQQIIKLGVTDNIPERNSTYLTSEYISGTFTNVIRIPSSRRTLLDNHLKDVLKPYHKGKLIWACGLGKALTSLFIVKKLEYIIHLICL